MAAWLKATEGGVVMALRIVPRASRDAVAGVMGEALKIRLRAPPVDGKANAALRAFLAEALEVPERAITILSGETGRMKRVRVEGVGEASAIARLSP